MAENEDINCLEFLLEVGGPQTQSQNVVPNISLGFQSAPLLNSKIKQCTDSTECKNMKDIIRDSTLRVSSS